MSLVEMIGDVLDTSKESSHTADHDGFCVVDAQTSGFGGGGRERLSGREPLVTQQLGQVGTARVRGRRPNKRGNQPPIPLLSYKRGTLVTTRLRIPYGRVVRRS
jgi:hypothetical protein